LYNNNLHYAGQVMLSGTGLTQEEADSGKVLGPNMMLLSASDTAKFSYVEHSAKATGAMRQDLEDIKEEMEVLGVQPLIRQNVTATSQEQNQGDQVAGIEAAIRGKESASRGMFADAAKWMKTELPENFDYDIYSDFAIGLWGQNDFDQLLKARQSGEISRETFLAEIKRMGKLSEKIDVKKEIERVNAEGPALGTMGIEGQLGSRA